MDENKSEGKKRYLANILSGSRPIIAVAICVAVVQAMVAGKAALPIWVLVAWGVLALTDWLDGVVARSNCGKTTNGATIDEMCDKIAINLTILALCIFGRIDWYFFAIMLGRDIFVTIVRMRSREAGIDVVTNARFPGKAKTCLQFFLVLVALMPAAWLGALDALVIFVLSASAMGMSLVSGMQILLLAMNAKDSTWLEGAHGEIGAPNWWSLSRIAASAAIPYMIGVQPFGYASNIITIFMLIYAISTDKIDGYLAVKLNQFTKAGKALDPLSDKVLFYPVAIAMLVATKGTLLIPGIEEPAVVLVMCLSLFLMTFRDLAFIVWYAFGYRDLPEGISSSGWDKARMVAMCVWLGAMALAMCTQEVPVGTVFAWVAYICLIITGLTLSIASGAVAIYRLQDLKAKIKADSE
ncbi:MAG: CDP-alcohol phosphatidyltransferase family protein [Candidatus Saccharimonadales bacterium]